MRALVYTGPNALELREESVPVAVAGDVVVKVESQQMASKSDWLKAIRNHRGQLVQVTVMRNKQEQVLSMSAGKLKSK